MNTKIESVWDVNLKSKITRKVLEALPQWFGIEEARENYIIESEKQFYFSATVDNEVVGFIAMKETSKHTLELAVMGVLEKYHKQGIGKALFESAYKYAFEKDYLFIQVKTVEMGKYEEYDKTNKFYLSLGFKEFEIFPTLWDKANPCQIYIMSIK